MLKDAMAGAMRLVKDVLGVAVTPPIVAPATNPPPKSAPADDWIAGYCAMRKAEAAPKIRCRLTLDDVETEGPSDDDIRSAAALVAAGKRDFLCLERADVGGFDSDEDVEEEAEDADADDFLQLSSDSAGSFVLEFGVDLGGADPVLFEGTVALTADAVTEALVDYRRGGDHWLVACGWRRKP